MGHKRGPLKTSKSLIKWPPMQYIVPIKFHSIDPLLDLYIIQNNTNNLNIHIN